MPRRKEDSNVVALPRSFQTLADRREAHRSADAFKASPTMKKARARCRELVDDGTLSPLEWLPVLREEKFLTSEDWREWSDMEGFEGWWFDGLYPKATPNSLLSMTSVWFAGLGAALARGDTRALEWYHRNVLQVSAQGQTMLEELLGKKKDGTPSKWDQAKEAQKLAQAREEAKPEEGAG